MQRVRKTLGAILSDWLVTPSFEWAGKHGQTTENAINVCFENVAGEVDRFGHAFPGYFLPLADRYARHPEIFQNKTLFMQPAPAGSLRPILGWRNDPRLLVDMIRTIFPELKCVFVGRRFGAPMVRIPGGIARRPAYSMETDPKAIPRVANMVLSRRITRIEDSGLVPIYIRRGDDPRLDHGDQGASRRFIRNEREVLSVLQKRWPNVRVLVLEDLEFPDQIQELNRASVVVGQHGSGLWNVVWAERCGALIELAPIRDHFHVVADLAGVPYYEVSRIPETTYSGNTYRGGVTVDCSELESIVRSLPC